MDEEEVPKDITDAIFESAENTLTVSSLILVKDFIKKWRFTLAPDELLMQNHDHIPLDKLSPNKEHAIPEELLEELFIVTRLVGLRICVAFEAKLKYDVKNIEPMGFQTCLFDNHMEKHFTPVAH